MGDQDQQEEEVRLTDLPAEITEHIVSMLPSLALYSLPTLSPDLATSAAREMAIRHQKVTRDKTSAANRLIGEVVQSRRRPLLGPSPG